MTGEHTVGTFASINDTELHVADHTPQRGNLNHLQCAIESAALDLALKQSGQTLGEILDRKYEPVNFVASPSLGDPPSICPVHRLHEAVPGLGFKIDVPEDPSETFVSELAATDAIRVLDLKGQYGPDIGAPADPELYGNYSRRFPT